MLIKELFIQYKKYLCINKSVTEICPRPRADYFEFKITINCPIYVWAHYSPLDTPNLSLSLFSRRRWQLPVTEERNPSPPMRQRIALAAPMIAPSAVGGDRRARACHHLRRRALCWASTPIRFRTTISRGESTRPPLKASLSALDSKADSPFSLFSLASAAGNCSLRPGKCLPSFASHFFFPK